MRILVREYQETQDAVPVGRLIADTYAKFNLSFTSGEERAKFLGPFQYAHSSLAAHQAAVAEVLRAPMIFVAEDKTQVVGILRGRAGRLHSLFVQEAYHRQGIGRQLMSHFEAACRQQGSRSITLAATRYAVPFYQQLGYKKSTGIRRGRSFEGQGFPYQPMKKILAR